MEKSEKEEIVAAVREEIVPVVREEMSAVKAEMKTEMRIVAREEADRVLGIYTEQIDDRFKVVGERFDHLEGRMDGMEKTLAEHTEILKDLAVDMVAVKSDIKVINAKLDRKADVKDLAMLDRRVTALENGKK